MKLVKCDKGQGMVEFVLVLPILILMVMAIIEFGFMFNAYLGLSNGVREAGRLAALGASDSTIELKIEETSGQLNAENIQVTISPASRRRGDSITIDLVYTYNFITPIIGGLFTSGVDLQTQIIVRME